jgi:oxalate decarboxylase/phosphoglucose isomerase-like protein (cupin superfamily)
VVSVFEAEVAPGFDVGAHRHRHAEELFYILEGELDLLAFEDEVLTAGSWTDWVSGDGAKVARGGRGATMYVPPGCPHAFANPGRSPARMLFMVSPPGHEFYLFELAELLATAPVPDQEAAKQLRARHDIEQLTPLVPGHTGPAEVTPPGRAWRRKRN